MIGIGIVTYNDLIDRGLLGEPDIVEVTCACIETINMFTEDEFIIIIRDNNSLDYRYKKFDVILNSKYKEINILFIPSMVNELTDAWNEILTIGFDKYDCEAMVLLNNDIIVTKYWQNYIDAIKVQSRDLLGPVSDEAPYQPIQTVIEEAFMPEDSLFVVPTIQGHCLGGSKLAFEANKYDDVHYFDPEVEWAFNEEEWVQRNNAKGGRCLIVMNSYIIHLNAATWSILGALQSSKVPTEPILGIDRLAISDILNYNDYIEGKCSI